MSERRFPMRKIEWDTVIGQNEDGTDIFADSLPVWAYDQLQAAPEMLELLREIEPHDLGDGDYFEDKIRALLAKIDGEEAKV